MNNQKVTNKKLVILGNGFDLNLGMKSRFSDFANSKYGKEVLQQNRWSNPRPYWYNFEENMAQNYTSALLKRVRAEKKRVKSSHLHELKMMYLMLKMKFGLVNKRILLITFKLYLRLCQTQTKN